MAKLLLNKNFYKQIKINHHQNPRQPVYDQSLLLLFWLFVPKFDLIIRGIVHPSIFLEFVRFLKIIK